MQLIMKIMKTKMQIIPVLLFGAFSLLQETLMGANGGHRTVKNNA